MPLYRTTRTFTLTSGGYLAKHFRFLKIALVAASLIVSSGTASAAAAKDEPGQPAILDGVQIDLKKGWGPAHTCVVLSAETTQCFRTGDEADRSLGYDPVAEAQAHQVTEGTVEALPACASDWMCLYEHIDGGGRRLIFNAEYWHDLANWNFRNMTSSIRNNQSCEDGGSTLDMGGQAQFDYEGCAYYSQLAVNDQADMVHG